MPVNLLRVRIDTETVPAFLSIGWGLLADIGTSFGSHRLFLFSEGFVVVVSDVPCRAWKLVDIRSMINE